MRKVALAGALALALAGCGSTQVQTVTHTATVAAESVKHVQPAVNPKPVAKPKPVTTQTQTTRTQQGSSCPAGQIMTELGCRVHRQQTPQSCPPGYTWQIWGGKGGCDPAMTQQYQTTTTTDCTTNPVIQTSNIQCDNSGQVNMDSVGRDVTCPPGKAAYWVSGTEKIWCADPTGPYDNACFPPIEYATANGASAVGPLGTPACDPAINPEFVQTDGGTGCPSGYSYNAEVNYPDAMDCQYKP